MSQRVRTRVVQKAGLSGASGSPARARPKPIHPQKPSTPAFRNQADPAFQRAATSRLRWGPLVLLTVGMTALAYGGFMSPLPLVGGNGSIPGPRDLTKQNPNQTQMMRRRAAEAAAVGKSFRPRQRWLRLAQIAPTVRNAVIAAEDSTFYRHRGVEWGLTRAAFWESWKTGRRARGASTLTQQVARNLYLSPQKTYVRKMREIILAQRLEQALTKDRLLEIYLNIAEWGDGIFGIEAASRAYFNKSAADLTWDEAVALTAVLPSPRRHRPTEATQWLALRKAWVFKRLADTGRYTPPVPAPASPPTPL